VAVLLAGRVRIHTGRKGERRSMSEADYPAKPSPQKISLCDLGLEGIHREHD
jgi:hypothetical protein